MSSKPAPAALPRGPHFRLGGFLGVPVLLLPLLLLAGAALAFDPLVGVAAVILAIIVMLVVLKPDVATLLVVGVIFSNAAVVVVNQVGLPYLIAGVLPLLLLVPLVYHALVRRVPLVAPAGLPWLLALFLAWVTSMFFSRDPTRSAAEVVSLVTEGLLLYLLVVNVIHSPALLRQLVWVLVLVGAALGALSTYQWLAGDFGNTLLGFAQTDSNVTVRVTALGERIGQARVAGPIGEVNRYGQIMLVLLPLCWSRYLGERRRSLRLLGAGATVLTLLATMLTFSRGAAVGFLIVLAVAAALRYVRIRHLLALALALALLLTALPQYRVRVANLTAIANLRSSESSGQLDRSTRSRVTETLAGALMFADHPLLGVGPGLYNSYYLEYAGRVGLEVRNEPREPHNLFFGLGAETGAIGLLLFTGLVVATLRELIRARRQWLHREPELANMATAFILALVAYLGTGIFLHLSYARYLWLLLALAGAAGVVLRRQQPGSAWPTP